MKIPLEKSISTQCKCKEPYVLHNTNATMKCSWACSFYLCASKFWSLSILQCFHLDQSKKSTQKVHHRFHHYVPLVEMIRKYIWIVSFVVQTKKIRFWVLNHQNLHGKQALLHRSYPYAVKIAFPRWVPGLPAGNSLRQSKSTQAGATPASI